MKREHGWPLSFWIQTNKRSWPCHTGNYQAFSTSYQYYEWCNSAAPWCCIAVYHAILHYRSTFRHMISGRLVFLEGAGRRGVVALPWHLSYWSCSSNTQSGVRTSSDWVLLEQFQTAIRPAKLKIFFQKLFPPNFAHFGRQKLLEQYSIRTSSYPGLSIARASRV